MFERYTEKARRVIFFARYEASQFGSPYIETEHLLLGLLREDKALTNRFLRSHASVESIRKQIEGHTTIREKVSTSVDLPLSNECKRVLAYAAEEAERLSHKHIGTEHLLLGLLREEKCFAAEILHERGLRLSTIREELARSGQEKAQPQRQRESSLLSEFSRDLTQAAMDTQLDPLVGREGELERVIQILCRRTKNNPVLIGEPGVGKTAIVEGLAQRIADGEVPSFLADKRILALDLSLIVAGTKYRGQFEERLKTIMKELMESQNSIIFIDELHTLVGAGSAEGSLDAANILKPALSRGEIQCIGATTPGEYRKSIEKDRSLERRFQAVKVPPPDEVNATKILFGIKDRYEKFHAVTYTDDAINFAVSHSNRYIPDRFLPDKAIDLVDEAGARVKLRQTSLPEEITEVQKRIKFIVHRMENAIANHEFEKARFYSDEERKERENLRALREKYHLDESATGVVGREDIEDVVSRWTGVPITSIKEEESQKLLRIEEELHKRVISQDKAIVALARAIRRSRAGLKSPNRPIGSFLFFGLGDLVSVLEFKVDDIYKAGEVARQLEQAAGPGFMSTNWMEQNKALFRALRLERLVTFITIGLIVFVAALNILISLTMMVMEKTRDIAVLMSMGTRKSQVRRVFITQGVLIGVIGTAIGLVLGYALSWTGAHYHLLSLAPEVYSIDYVPFAPRAIDGVLVALVAIGISLVATVYPSWSAARILPAEALRYE